jgi:4-aminobutyrate--pyruvate transaminase
VVKRAQAHGAILRNMAGDIIAFSPPLIISEKEIDELIDKTRRALDDALPMARERGLVG